MSNNTLNILFVKLMFVNRPETYQHPPGVARCCSRAPSPSSRGTKSFSEHQPPLLLVLYGRTKVSLGLIYLLSFIIRQAGGGRRDIILSGDVNPSEWNRTGLGYVSCKVDAEIHPRSLCLLHTLWRRRSRSAASFCAALLSSLYTNFSQHSPVGS